MLTNENCLEKSDFKAHLYMSCKDRPVSTSKMTNNNLNAWYRYFKLDFKHVCKSLN